MDLNINTWNITLTQNNIDNYDIHSLIESYFTNKSNMGYLLDTNKDKYCVIEKFVYDTAMFHFKELGIEYNKNEHYIEFWLKNTYTSTCHVDTDEYEQYINNEFNYKIRPLLTSVTYLSESNIPTVITDIKYDDYVNDNYSENKIFLSFPKYLKQITFNGGNYFHGTCKIFDNETFNYRSILAINLWNIKLNKMPYFDDSTFQFMNFREHNKFKIINPCIDNNIVLLNFKKNINNARFLINNNSLINKQLFKYLINTSNDNHGDLFYRFSNILNENNYENYDLIELYNHFSSTDDMKIIQKNNIHNKITNEPTCGVDNKVINESVCGVDNKNIKDSICDIYFKNPQLKNTMIVHSFFDTITSNWLINNIQKYLLKKKSQSIINPELLPNITSFISFSFVNLFKKKITEFYNLNSEKQKFNITNILIINNNNNIKEIKYDLSIKIILSNNDNNFKFISKDGNIYNLNTGDSIIHPLNSIEEISYNKNSINSFYILTADVNLL
jgi:hypothetical protein